VAVLVGRRLEERDRWKGASVQRGPEIDQVVLVVRCPVVAISATELGGVCKRFCVDS